MSAHLVERTYAWDGRVPTPASLREVDGLTYVQRILAGTAPSAPIAQTLGFSLAEVAAGRAVFVGRAERFVFNPMGAAHGGWVATMLDSAMGCAVHTTLAAGEGYTTLELSVRMVRPVTEASGATRAIGQVVHAGGSVRTAEGQLLDADGRLLAHGATTCMILRPR